MIFSNGGGRLAAGAAVRRRIRPTRRASPGSYGRDALVALRGLRRGVQQEAGEGAGQLAGEDPDADLYPAR
jgi:hypothetical protein